MKTDYEAFRNVKVLDCSIRDGGHLNKWNFEDDFVKKLFKTVSKTGIDIIEVGYRSTPEAFPGCEKWRYTTDEDIEMLLDKKVSTKIAIMADVGKIKISDFKPSEETRYDVIRLAFYKNDIDEAISLSVELEEMGYIVTFNMMGITKYTDKELREAIEKIRKTNIDLLYIADSFGSMYPDDVERLIKILKKETGKTMGFHAHNNLDLALANSIAAIRAGAEYVDATVNGMGRGAGNLPLETILLFLNRFNKQRYNPIPLLEFIEKDVKDFKKKSPWGEKIEFVLSAINNCHPNYANALEKKGYSIKEIFSVLSNINKIDNIGFSEELLQKAIDQTVIVDDEHKIADISKLKITTKIDSPSYIDRHKGKDFLVVANGPSLSENEDKINDFVKKNDLVVIGCNYLGEKIVPDYHLFTNHERFSQYVATVNPKSKLIVGRYLEDYAKKAKNLPEFEVMQYVKENGFEIKNGIVYTDPSTVAVMMISLAMTMGAKNIYVVGMDGYKIKGEVHFYGKEDVAKLDSKESLQLRMENDLKLIHDYQKEKGSNPFAIITPTAFNNYYKEGLL